MRHRLIRSAMGAKVWQADSTDKKKLFIYIYIYINLFIMRT